MVLWNELQLGGNDIIVDETRPLPADRKAGDMWYKPSENKLCIVSDPNGADNDSNDPWIQIIPGTVGSFENTDLLCDRESSINSTLQYQEKKNPDDSTYEIWAPKSLTSSFALGEMTDVYLEPPTRPRAGESLGYSGDVLGDSSLVEGFIPIVVGPVRLADVVVEDPKDTGTRFTGKSFKVKVTLSSFTSMIFKIRAYVVGSILRADNTRDNTEISYCDLQVKDIANVDVKELNKINNFTTITLPAPDEEIELDLHFPDTFSSGDAPDDVLPDGTSLVVDFEVIETDTGGTIKGESDLIVPAESGAPFRLNEQRAGDQAAFDSINTSLNQYEIDTVTRTETLKAAYESAVVKLTNLGLTEPEIHAISKLL